MSNTVIHLSLVTLALSVLIPSVLNAAPDVRVVAKDISDTRSTDNFFAKLEVKAKLVGDVMADAKGVRSTITTAVDDTGRDLVNPKKAGKAEESKGFEETDGDDPEITLSLASPARSAKTVQKIEGTLEIFVPKLDPAARIIVPNVLAHTGSSLNQEGLEAAGMQVVVWNREEYTAYKKKQEAAQKAAPKSDKSDIGEALVTGLKDAFSKMFGMSDTLGPNDIALTVVDPKSRMVSVEFENAAGEKIESQSQMTNGSSQTFSFDKPLPATARLRLFIATPASVITMPLTLSDVPLP